MSRTWKDRPIHVREREAMEQGRIHHFHDYFGREPRVREGYFADRELSLKFYKHETKAIARHRAKLDQLVDEGAVSRYELIEIPTQFRVLRDEDGLGCEFERTPKVIEFAVYRLYVHTYQDLCTDAEHFDPRTRTDTRNGLRATCTPDWSAYEGLGGSSLIRKRNERSEVRAALRKALTEIDMDDLEDEGYSDPTYELDYGRKIWYWDD